MTQAFLCEAHDPPCGLCRSCRKVGEGIHPDVKTLGVDEQTAITVEQVRQIRREAYIKAGEARGKVFIIRYGENLNPNGANALLKVIEEPPEGTCFIFTTKAPDLLPVTIRSRCETITLAPPRESRESSPLAQEFLELLLGGDPLAAAAFAVNNEKLGRKELEPLLAELRCTAAERAARADPVRAAALLKLCRDLDRAQTFAASNGGTGHILAWLAAVSFEQ